MATARISRCDADADKSLPLRRTDAEEVILLQRIADNGDTRALEALYKTYRPRLAGFLRRVTDDQELISESVNEVMYRVWKHAGQFSGGAKVSSWIFSIAYRECRRIVDKEKKHANIADVMAADADLQDVATDRSAADDRELIQAALMQLPPEQRLAIEMSYFLGKSVRDIAEIANCPENTVKTRMHHARRKLRELIPALTGTDNCRAAAPTARQPR